MKKLIIISLTTLILSSCGESSAEKTRRQIESMYADPILKEYYGQKTVDKWYEIYRTDKSSESLLETHKGFILDKLANAEAEITIQKTLDEN